MAIYGDEREYIPILQMMSTHDKNRRWASSATDITDVVDRTVLKIGGKRFLSHIILIPYVCGIARLQGYR